MVYGKRSLLKFIEKNFSNFKIKKFNKKPIKILILKWKKTLKINK